MNINGNIENIIFRNDVNGFTVLLVKASKTVFTLVGNISAVNIGETIEADVTEVNHETFGLQYKINSYKILIPDENIDAIYKFLISLSIKGVGEATIKRIIDNFGKDTIDIIKNNPEKLLFVKGLTEQKISDLNSKVISRQNEIDIILKLEKYSLGSATIKKIIDKYGDKTLSIINKNPYQLAIDIDGIGFAICDKIAHIDGFDDSSEKRVMAGILYILETNYASGNVFIKKCELIEKARNLLSLSENYSFNDALYNLEIDLKIKSDSYNNNELIFLRSSYNIEKRLSELLYNKRDYVTIVTGGPGTGKTYNIKQYLNDASNKGLKVSLCAPTGRAAKRITEMTGYEAKTIHRLLECIGDEEGKKLYFQFNEDNKLDTDMLIVDEMSMVDEYLMLALIKALPDLTRIILVGDVDQLPSVGAGQVLKDIINSGFFNVKKLTNIFRQDEGSNIVINAHLVNEGKSVVFENKSEDFVFSHKNTDKRIKDTILTLVKENIPKHFGLSNDQIQVICPSKKNECGTESLNKVLQEAINPESFDKSEIKVGDTIFRLGDKVMQTVNNYSIPYDVISSDGRVYDKGVGIFNGDIGEIVEIDEELRNMVIKYDDREAYYISKDLVDLSLAYAITVHKSQGSEYDVVIMPMTKFPYQLMNRKILYTAMTRAKKCIVFVGNEEYFNIMLNNVNDNERNSALCSKLYLYDI